MIIAIIIIVIIIIIAIIIIAIIKYSFMDKADYFHFILTKSINHQS